MKKLLLLHVICLFASTAIAAGTKLGQARLFLGPTSADPKEFNTNLTNSGLQKVDLINNFGVEITFPLLSALNGGMRYTKKLFGAVENPESTATDFAAEGDQNAILLVARASLMKSDSFMLDAFIGGGGTNTKATIRTATGTVTLDKTASKDWLASPYGAAGIAVSMGYKKTYFTIEAGYEMNKVSSFTKSGTGSSNYNELDLGGSYFTLGITYDAIPTFTK